MTAFFKNSNPNCAIKKFAITHLTGKSISANSLKTVVFDETLGDLTILNNINKAKLIWFTIQAETSGGEFVYKKMLLSVTDNKPPYFKGYEKKKGLKEIIVKVKEEDKDAERYIKIKLPKAVDDEKNKILYKFSGQKRKWISKATKNVIIIDTQKIKSKDAGAWRVGLRLRDDKYRLTRLETNFLIPIKIEYIEKPKPKKEKKEDKAANATADATAADGTTTDADAKVADPDTDAKATAADGTAADADATAADADATAADGTAADATAADSTDKAAADKPATAAADKTDKKTAVKEKPKDKIVKSGGQLAGLAVNVDKGSSKKEVKKEKPAPPPVDSLPITEQVTLKASPTAPPKATIAPLVNPESTAISPKKAKAAMNKLGAGLKKRFGKKKNKKTKKTKTTGAAGTTEAAPEEEVEVEEAPVEDLGPMKVKTGKMDASGGLPIKPNQPTVDLGIASSVDPKTGRRRLFIQNFYEHPVTGRRQLLGVSELDVQRDVMDLTFITETDQETNPIGYYLDLESWDSNGVKIAINYTDPLMVGKGNDQVMTTLKNPDLFVSAASGEALPKEDATTIKFSPT